MTEMRCSNGCCDDAYSSKEIALQIAEAEKKGERLDKFLPKPSCPTFGTTINETVQATGY